MGTYSTVWGTSLSLSGLKRATVKIISGVAEMSASSLSLESQLLEVVFTEPLLLTFASRFTSLRRTLWSKMSVFRICELPALCSKRQDFRVFQQIWRDLATNTKDPSLRELALFSQVYSGKIHDFGRRKQENLYRTFLFWKTSQEVTEIQE